MKMRGQAFVVFNDITEATVAMRALQQFPLFDRPMVKTAFLLHSFFSVSPCNGFTIYEEKYDVY